MPKLELKKVTDLIWELPKHEEMRVPARIYGDQIIIDALLAEVSAGQEWNALFQMYNVAALPGIVNYALAMSDVHPGYGFPIGGVAAFDIETGVVAAAGVGFDINCGIRCLKTDLTEKELTPLKKEKLADELFRSIPAGVGSEGDIKLKIEEIDKVLEQGAEFAIERGYGIKEDLEFIEEHGRIGGTEPENVSLKAKQRGYQQVGTLGSGNHYLEVQVVEEIVSKRAADVFGLFAGQVIISIHCGSRGLGHQIGSDYLISLAAAAKKYHIPIRERELVCAPISSPEGKKYLSALNCGINSAFANRQTITHLTRLAFKRSLGVSPQRIKTLYEIGHNTLKVEKHKVNGKIKKLAVHRKGATRGFGPDHPEIPTLYQGVGQPIIIGGTMGTSSYILHGTTQAMEQTWGSTCHGAGRAMSRVQAKRKWRGENLVKELSRRGIIIKGHSLTGLAEEAPLSYKDVERVVNVMDKTGISKKVARLRPIISVKG